MGTSLRIDNGFRKENEHVGKQKGTGQIATRSIPFRTTQAFCIFFFFSFFLFFFPLARSRQGGLLLVVVIIFVFLILLEL